MIETLLSTALFVGCILYIGKPFFSKEATHDRPVDEALEEKQLTRELESERLAELTLDLDIGKLDKEEYADLVQVACEEDGIAKTCKACGAETSQEDRFCRNCGEKLL